MLSPAKEIGDKGNLAVRAAGKQSPLVSYIPISRNLLDPSVAKSIYTSRGQSA